MKRIKKLRVSFLFFVLSYLSLVVLGWYLDEDVAGEWGGWGRVAGAIVSAALLWYPLYLASVNRILLALVSGFMTLLITVKIYYTQILGVHIEPTVFEGMFDTSPEEMARLGSYKPLLLFLVFFFYVIIILEFGWLRSHPLKRRLLFHTAKLSGITVLVVAILVGSGISVWSATNLLESIFPLDFLQNFYTAVSARYRLYLANRDRESLLGRYEFIRKESDPVTVVVVRGESLRARSFPINDARFPKDLRLSGINNTVYLNNVFSYANYTQAAVPWMLVRSIDDHLLNEKSFISVVRGKGFDTTWLGCDSSNVAGFAVPIVNFSFEAHRSLFTGKLNDWLKQHDSDELSMLTGPPFHDDRQFKYLLATLMEDNQRNRFFWVEMNGSHVPWAGFDSAYRYAEPICHQPLDEVRACSEQAAVNAYNSTVLATQHLLRRLIGVLKSRNAVVIFASDHGESTGEDGFYGHGFMLPKGSRRIRDQINPAFMVWMSDRFRQNYPERFIALMKNADAYMTHDVIFHSVLDLLGFESEVIDKRRSIFSDSFVSRQPFVDVEYQEKGVVVVDEGYDHLFLSVSSDVHDTSFSLVMKFRGKGNPIRVSLVADKGQSKWRYRLRQSNQPAAQGELGAGESASVVIGLTDSRSLELILLPQESDGRARAKFDLTVSRLPASNHEAK